MTILHCLQVNMQYSAGPGVPLAGKTQDFIGKINLYDCLELQLGHAVVFF